MKILSLIAVSLLISQFVFATADRKVAQERRVQVLTMHDLSHEYVVNCQATVKALDGPTRMNGVWVYPSDMEVAYFTAGDSQTEYNRDQIGSSIKKVVFSVSQNGQVLYADCLKKKSRHELSGIMVSGSRGTGTEQIYKGATVNLNYELF